MIFQFSVWKTSRQASALYFFASSNTERRALPGMGEAMMAANLQKTSHAMISRAVAGIRGWSLIVNLLGSPKGAVESLDAIFVALPHALDKIQGDPSD